MNGDSGSMHRSEIKRTPYFRDIQHAIKLINISKLDKVKKWSDVNSSTQATHRKNHHRLLKEQVFIWIMAYFDFFVLNNRCNGVKNDIISKNISKLGMLRQWSNIHSSTRATNRKLWLVTDETSYYMDHDWLHDFVQRKRGWTEYANNSSKSVQIYRFQLYRCKAFRELFFCKKRFLNYEWSECQNVRM